MLAEKCQVFKMIVSWLASLPNDARGRLQLASVNLPMVISDYDFNKLLATRAAQGNSKKSMHCCASGSKV